jgi:hypothetical protein
MDADSNIADGFWRSYRAPSRLPSPSAANSGQWLEVGFAFFNSRFADGAIIN